MAHFCSAVKNQAVLSAFGSSRRCAPSPCRMRQPTAPADRCRSRWCAGEATCASGRSRLVDAAQHQQRQLLGGARHRLRVAADAEIEQQALLDHDETCAAARSTRGPTERRVAHAAHIAYRREGLLDPVEDTVGGLRIAGTLEIDGAPADDLLPISRVTVDAVSLAQPR